MAVVRPTWLHRRRGWLITTGVGAVLIAGGLALTSAVQRQRMNQQRSADQ